MYGQYKRLHNEVTGVLTGKGLTYGGSLARTEATGFGLCYFTQEMLACMRGDSFAGKTVVISGSGNVAIYACQKATEYGAKVVALSDSNGYIHDPNGIDLAVVKQIKEVERGRIKEYADRVSGATYTEGCSGIWSIPCDIALPCATQNEIDGASADLLIKNGTTVVAEGANMPQHARSDREVSERGRPVRPGQAERRRRRDQRPGDVPEPMRYSWTFEEVDAKLKGIMENIFTARTTQPKNTAWRATSSPARILRAS